MDTNTKLEQVLKVLRQVRGWNRGRARERKSYGHRSEALPFLKQAEKLDIVITALTDVLENLKKE